MTSKRMILLTLIMAMLAFLFACREDKQYPPLSQVSKVDLNRYLGRWYEIARIDHSFQRDCVASTADYSLRPDGDIKVVNTCIKKSPEGKISSVEGKAWVVNNETNSWLKVQFFWPFRGDYVIIDLDEKEYRYAVIGHPSRDYLWVLARAPQMDDGTYREILNKISKQGYDLGRIQRYSPVN